MDSNTARRIGLFQSLVKIPTEVYGLCNNPVPVIGYVDALIGFAEREATPQRIQILDSEEPTLLLGRQFMKKLGSVKFDFEKGLVKLGGSWSQIGCTINGCTPLARAQVVMQIEELDRDSNKEAPELVNPRLTKREQERLRGLVEDHGYIFSGSRKQPARTKLSTRHAIITGDALPQCSRPRRVPPKWEAEINCQLQEMLGANPPICQPSKSPWSSDVVLVKKKDGTLRFAVDYRRLNAITKRDVYSLPNPQSIFDKLRGNCFFTKLDIASAYWTVPILESDIEKTAFHTPRGLFEMVVMPFGLCNSQSTFQRLMDQALRGAANVESFVDDILVFSGSLEEHLIHLEEVFRRLEVAGLRLRKDKCRLAYRGVEFLGHWISENGRSPLKSYTKRLQEFPKPKNVKELQRCMGMMNYYRCYIRNFALMAEPLYALMRSGCEWKWDERCEKAFDELRTWLLKEPVTLSYPDWDQEFHIETDACSSGIGATLGQKDDRTGKIRPMDFFSSSLSHSQRNYSAGQLEAWGAVAATRKWSVYLKGATGVVLHTDHCPLKWILAHKDPKPTFARWMMELQEIPLRVEIRAGKDNPVADYLSRKDSVEIDPDVNREDKFEDNIFSTQSVNSLQRKIKRYQGKDPVIREAIEHIKGGGKVDYGQLKKVNEHLQILEDTLFFDERIIVPKSLQLEVTEAVHAQHHLGLTGTLQSLKRSYFWRNMPRDVRKFCNSCLACQRAKPTNIAKQPLQRMEISGDTPGYAVGIDVGTLPWSEGGYRYFLLMVDLFSRYMEVYPLKDQEATSLVKAFEQGWIYRGHGVPARILSDQGSNIDGHTFREFCRQLGVEKRRTTPYHPETDGMAERNIGMVKQVIRCLQLDRKLPKESWPSLLSEVSFHCNGMNNATSNMSPHLLIRGRQPRCPMDAWCNTLKPCEVNSHGEYLESLLTKQEVLKEIAQGNISRNTERIRIKRNEKRNSSHIRAGQSVMLRRNIHQDSLAPRFDGPFVVLKRKGPNVKLRLSTRDKWVHLNHCKVYKKMEPSIIQTSIPTLEANTGRNEDDTYQAIQHDLVQAPIEQPEWNGSAGSISEMGEQTYLENQSSIDEEPTIDVTTPYRRYPLRNKRKPARFSSFIPWSEIDDSPLN